MSTLYLFFFNRWVIILHVVDFPFVPVTTIDLNLKLLKYNKSKYHLKEKEMFKDTPSFFSGTTKALIAKFDFEFFK